MTPRIEVLKQKIIDTIPDICSERAVLMTASYQETEGWPNIIRRAKGLEKVLREMTIYILDGELIVGNQASKPRSAPVFPEFSIDWIEKEFNDFFRRPHDKFSLRSQAKEKLENIFPYWKGKTHKDKVISTTLAVLPKDVIEYYDVEGFNLNQAVCNATSAIAGDGHVVPSYNRALEIGIEGIILQARNEMEKIDMFTYDGLRKKLFLEAVILVNEAVVHFANRFSEKAGNMAKIEKDGKRKIELEEIARICRQVPGKPPRSFREALQFVWFVHLVTQIESNGHGMSLGRLDQYLYQFFKSDTESKKLTQTEAVEMIECFLLKCNELNKLRKWVSTRYKTGYPMFQNLSLGGIKNDGRDATNELSYLFLKATGDTKLPQPTVVALLHSNTPEGFRIKCCETLIEHGGGMPGFFNCEVAIPLLLNMGVPLREARDWAPVSCCEIEVPGKWNTIVGGATYINFAKILELALENGKNPRNGKTLHRGIGSLEELKSFDDVKKAYREQLSYYTSFAAIFDNITASTFAELTPTPFLSGLIDYRIELGKDVSEGGGPNYNNTIIEGHGMATVGDSLSAIKKLVFDDRVISTRDLMNALRCDFCGQDGEKIRQIILNKAPKYGMDDDYADEITKETLNYFIEEVSKYKPIRGGKYGPTVLSLSANVPEGEVVGATPDGRKSGEPTSDNASPSAGADVNGPTAAMKSVAKIENFLLTNGSVLNLKFSPTILKAKDGIAKFSSLIKTFFDLKGFQVQFNILSADKLRDAQRHPEKYKGLIVKVAGYSAYFDVLDKKLQDNIIARTEHNL